MKKRLFSMLLAAVLCVSLAACGTKKEEAPVNKQGDEAQEQKGEEAEEKETYTMRFSHCNATTTFNHDIVMHFVDLVEANSNGQIKVEVYPAAQLMPLDQEMAAVLDGRIEACYSHGYLGENVTPMYRVYNYPNIFGDTEETYENMLDFNENIYKEKILPAFEDYGFVAYNGAADPNRAVFTMKSQIKTVEDLKGLKIRTGSGAAGDVIGRALGFNPVAISSSEMLTAFMQGTVDGTVIGPIYGYANQIPNIKYCAVNNIDYPGLANMICISKEWFDSLPENLQQVLNEAGEDTTKWAIEECRTRANEAWEGFEKEMGVEMYTFPEEELQKEMDLFAPYAEEYTKEHPEVKEIWDYMLENYAGK